MIVPLLFVNSKTPSWGTQEVISITHTNAIAPKAIKVNMLVETTKKSMNFIVMGLGLWLRILTRQVPLVMPKSSNLRLSDLVEQCSV